MCFKLGYASFRYDAVNLDGLFFYNDLSVICLAILYLITQSFSKYAHDLILFSL